MVAVKYTVLPVSINNKEELITLIRQRNEKGFSLLYDNYSAALFGVITRIVCDTACAEDVLQETFVKIWRKIDQYDECKGTFFTWMLNIARNTSIDHTRSKNYIQKQLANPGHQLSNLNIGPVDQQNTDHIGMQNIVSKMEPQYCQVIDMLYFNGYTQEEAAEALNIPIGTLKTRARKAIQILRTQF